MIIVIIGAQWGDEGKGKVVDLLADRFDVVARYQGGHNAGHSVYVGEKAFVLRLLPSGIIHGQHVRVHGVPVRYFHRHPGGRGLRRRRQDGRGGLPRRHVVHPRHP